MNPSKVDRNKIVTLTDLPNIGKVMAKDLQLIGINEPNQLIGQSPYKLYDKLCKKTGAHHDPCVLDVFISITRFMSGNPPRPWWEYTEERKQVLKKRSEST